eukprot:5880313-Pyramimonas_sp.AAC.1
MVNTASSWLRDQLSHGGGPLPHNMYMKGDTTNILFAEFSDTANRDTAVALIKNSRNQHNDKYIWASPDRPPMERAARNYCFGLKYLLKDTFKLPYIIKITDASPYEVNVGGEHALTVSVVGNS